MIDFLPGIRSTSSALQAERVRMEVIAQNIAEANTIHGIDGKPYQRQEVVFESVLNQQQGGGGTTGSLGQTVQVARIQKDTRPPRMIYNPGSPDADANGMVAMPNISVHEEMADLIASSRAYEANLAVARTSRTMAMQSLALGKA
jgi:flagellar basal-body rod protein FlgC